MKQIRSFLIAAVIFALVASVGTIPAFAVKGTTISASSKQVKVGDQIVFTVTIDGGEAMYAAEANFKYDSSMFRFDAGDSATGSGGNVHIVGTPGGATAQKYSLRFTALKEGSCTVSATDVVYVGNDEIPLTGASVPGITVKAATTSSAASSAASKTSSVTSSDTSSANTSSAKSSNANLASLKVSGGTLFPAFSASVTSYTVQVLYDVEKTSLTASAADNSAKVDGTGNVELTVGDNRKTVTVTAADGTKKTYNVNIRRLNEGEEITEPNAGEPSADDPLAVSVNGTAYHVVAKKTLPVPEGLSETAGEYNGTEIPVFTDESGILTVYELKNDTTGTSEYFTYRADRDEFSPLHYLQCGGAMYIFADEPGEYDPPEGYFRSSVSIGNGTVDAYASNNEKMTDFYIVYCFKNGKFGYYRYDCAEGIMQRSPDFVPVEHVDAEDAANGNFLENMDPRGKTVLLVCSVAALLIIVLIVLLIVMLARRRRENLLYDSEEEGEFINRNRDMFCFEDDLPKTSEVQLTFQTKPEESTDGENE